MAQILEENVLIKVSRLVKTKNEDSAALVSSEMVESLEAVVQELVGNSAVVEIEIISGE